MRSVDWLNLIFRTKEQQYKTIDYLPFMINGELSFVVLEQVYHNGDFRETVISKGKAIVLD